MVRIKSILNIKLKNINYLKKLKEVIGANKNISHLAVIHNETTTGLLNNLDDLGKIAKKYNLEFIVDAMSSYAAIPIDMKKQNIHYLLASSNKNIQGMAGVGFVIANVKSIEKLKDIKKLRDELDNKKIYLENIKQKKFEIEAHVRYLTKELENISGFFAYITTSGPSNCTSVITAFPGEFFITYCFISFKISSADKIDPPIKIIN